MPTEHQLLVKVLAYRNTAEGGLITPQTSLAYDFSNTKFLEPPFQGGKMSQS